LGLRARLPASFDNHLRDCRQPHTFHGREVIVRGFLVSDYFEHSAVVDPACRQGLVPMDAPDVKGQRDFDRALCAERGGLVAVTMRGEVRTQPDRPSILLHIREFSNPEHVAYDASWARDTLELESRTSWRDRRLMFCILARFVDPETRQRIDVAE
jgi:hypothetical protein